MSTNKQDQQREGVRCPDCGAASHGFACPKHLHDESHNQPVLRCEWCPQPQPVLAADIAAGKRALAAVYGSPTVSLIVHDWHPFAAAVLEAVAYQRLIDEGTSL